MIERAYQDRLYELLRSRGGQPQTKKLRGCHEFSATYVFASPVMGGQLAVGMTGAAGQNRTSIDGTLTTSVGPLTATGFGSISDQRDGFGDLYPLASLRWNSDWREGGFRDCYFLYIGLEGATGGGGAAGEMA